MKERTVTLTLTLRHPKEEITDELVAQCVLRMESWYNLRHKYRVHLWVKGQERRKKDGV